MEVVVMIGISFTCDEGTTMCNIEIIAKGYILDIHKESEEERCGGIGMS